MRNPFSTGGPRPETRAQESNHDRRNVRCPAFRLSGPKHEQPSGRTHEPHLLYELSPRTFEELVADILKDMGYEIRLTPQTRDGGRDVIAILKTPIGEMLTIVECKRYRPDRKIGVDIVERFLHVIERKDNASCGLIATTSCFSRDAEALGRQFEYRLKLRDFDGIKEWIGQHGKWKRGGKGLLWTPAYHGDQNTDAR